MFVQITDSSFQETHLIIGGTGFIGRHVALALAQRQISVVLASRREPQFEFPKAAAPFIKWEYCDIRQPNWDNFLERVDVVHYYAWDSTPAKAQLDPGQDLHANVLPLIELLKSLSDRRNISKKLLFASSGGTVYGRPEIVPIPETHRLQPTTAYGAGKVAAETYINFYRSFYGIDCRIARIANPFGAGQNLDSGQGVATIFAEKALRGSKITIWGSGQVVRDFIHVSDLSEALVRYASMERSSVTPDSLNIASGKGTSINEIINELSDLVGHQLDVSYSGERSYDVSANVLDIANARDLLNWSPKLTFHEGMERTLIDLVERSQLSQW